MLSMAKSTSTALSGLALSSMRDFNTGVSVHPKELDYAKNPNRADVNSASYFADMLARLKVEPV